MRRSFFRSILCAPAPQAASAGTAIRFGAACVVVFNLGFAGAAAGQDQGEPPAAPRFEFVGFGGANGGLTSIADAASGGFADGLQVGGMRNVGIDPGSSLRWLAGGGVGVGIGDNVLVTGEFAHSRLANPSFSGTTFGQTISVSMQAKMTEYVGGVQYLLSAGRVTPYVAAGIGLIRLAVSADSSLLPSSFSVSQTDLTSNFGGGLRMGTGGNWAIRPDFRIVRVPDEMFFRFSVGVLYQVR